MGKAYRGGGGGRKGFRLSTQDREGEVWKFKGLEGGVRAVLTGTHLGCLTFPRRRETR